MANPGMNNMMGGINGRYLNTPPASQLPQMPTGVMPMNPNAGAAGAPAPRPAFNFLNGQSGGGFQGMANGYGDYLKTLGWDGAQGTRHDFAQGLRDQGQHPLQAYMQSMGGAMGGMPGAAGGFPNGMGGPMVHPNGNTGIVPPDMQQGPGAGFAGSGQFGGQFPGLPSMMPNYESPRGPMAGGMPGGGMSFKAMRRPIPLVTR